MSDDDFEDLPAPPPDLVDPEAVAFFTGMIEALGDLDLVPDARELALITATAHQIAHVRAVAANLAETGMLSVGSKGQPVASPLLAAHTQAVNALTALLFKAKGILPAETAASSSPRAAVRSIRAVRPA